MAYQADVSDGLIGRCVLLRSSLTSLSKCVFQVTPLIVSEKPPAKWKAKEKDATETLQKRLREGQSNILVRPIPGVEVFLSFSPSRSRNHDQVCVRVRPLMKHDRAQKSVVRILENKVVVVLDPSKVQHFLVFSRKLNFSFFSPFHTGSRRG